MEDDPYFKIGAVLGFIVGICTFFYGWWYAIAHWGWFLGVAFGWIPAGIIAVIVGFLTLLLWGVALLAVLGLLVWLFVLQH